MSVWQADLKPAISSEGWFHVLWGKHNHPLGAHRNRLKATISNCGSFKKRVDDQSSVSTLFRNFLVNIPVVHANHAAQCPSPWRVSSHRIWNRIPEPQRPLSSSLGLPQASGQVCTSFIRGEIKCLSGRKILESMLANSSCPWGVRQSEMKPGILSYRWFHLGLVIFVVAILG